LLRGVVESIKSNRLVAPIFGLAVCAMFSQSVGLDRLVGWYTQLLIGIVPQIIVLRRIPAGQLGAGAAAEQAPAARALPPVGRDLDRRVPHYDQRCG